MREAEHIARLRAECERTSQTAVAKLIGYSPTVVNRILKGNYEGDAAAVQKAIEGALMGATVMCPVLREIAANRCLEIQGQPFAATNPTRVALFKACRSGCPHSRLQ
ncbi:MAG: helix-turn-helix transcriptional regulator [Candidatus Binatus sp.]